MAKILSFRSKDGTSAGQTYMTDDAEKLSFRTSENGVVSLDDVPGDSLPEIFADPRKDWTNQELADLFRVRRLLNGANVPVETLHGVSDEGDPWFIFCHPGGDVFIHMARIDGSYVLDSPNVRRPLRGADFNALIADFTNDALPGRGGDARGDTSARVIRLERGGKVHLHPSAMLAALIWTLFLASEDLVMITPEEPVEGADDLLDFTHIIAADADFAALMTDSAGTDGPSAADSFRIDHEETIHTADAQGHMREIMGQQGLAMQQNAYAMGLSTIAIAMGFVSEVVLMDNQHRVLEGLKTLGMLRGEADTTDTPQLDQIAGTSSDALMAKLADFLGLDLSLNTDMAELPVAPETDPLLQQDVLHVSGDALVETDPLPAPKFVQTLARKTADTDDAAETPQDMSQMQADANALLLMAAAQEGRDTVTVADLLRDGLQLEEFQLGQNTVMASFDLNSTDAFSLSDVLYLGQNTSGHQTFNARAQSFLNYLNEKEEVGVITIGNEMIMIDRAIFRENGADTYSFSWETYDGHVISMIGLRAEFQEFDLIA